MCDFRIASDGRVLRLRLRAHRRLARRRDDLLPAARRRPGRALELLLDDPTCRAERCARARASSRRSSRPTSCSKSRTAKAAELGAKAPHYVRMAKRLVAQSLDNSLADHLQLERHGIADSMGTEDLRDGVDAFFAGETPGSPAAEAAISGLRRPRRSSLGSQFRNREGIHRDQETSSCVRRAGARKPCPRRLREQQRLVEHQRRIDARQHDRHQRGGGGAGATVDIAADPSGALAFTKTDISTTAGNDTIDFDNESSTPHNVADRGRRREPGRRHRHDHRLHDVDDGRPEGRGPTRSSATSRATARPAWKARSPSSKRE